MEGVDRLSGVWPFPRYLKIGEIERHKTHQSPFSRRSIPLILSHHDWQSKKAHHLKHDQAGIPTSSFFICSASCRLLIKHFLDLQGIIR